jgi:simple sugar transport system permease protein
MSELVWGVFSLAFLGQMLRITVPYLLAAMGGVLSERCGVIDLALEAKLLVGAFCAALGADASGSALVGALAGVAGGLAVSVLYAVCVVRWGADQVVCGIAINLLALGLTRYLLGLIYGSTSNSPHTPGIPSRLVENPLFWAACVAAIAVHYVVYRTRFGLRLRATGEHPEAVQTLGVSVATTRWIALAGAGMVTGLGGAWLALSNRGFVAEMSGGRGYIALAAVIMGSWRPLWAAAACLLFGLAEALELQLQAADIGLPSEISGMLPYLLTIVALAGFIGRSRAPAALGKPYDMR